MRTQAHALFVTLALLQPASAFVVSHRRSTRAIRSGVRGVRRRSAGRLRPLRSSGVDIDDESVLQSPKYYEDKLCMDEDDDVEDEICELPGEDEFTVCILGDLHFDPRTMDDYMEGRSHFLPIVEDAKQKGVGCAVVSLGDLGESKSVRPDETDELFAGTTECHEFAADFLGSWGVPYEVVGGNHDLEGIDEFPTDAANLEAFLRIHGKPTPHFKREIAEKTLLVGLTSTLFREARYTSHEVTIDDDQIAWFEETVKAHPAAEGWKIFVFTHAPPIGSGLRVLTSNHVVNGCCWLNHSGGPTTRKFIELVREHRCIKAWFSGHFHLGQDYEDSITFPTIPRELGPYPNRGSCVFAQTSVMRGGTSRDKRRQSRLLRGNANGFEICTVNHAEGGTVRLDATITYTDSNHEVGVFAHDFDNLSENNNNFMKVYMPVKGDECYVGDLVSGAEGPVDTTSGCQVDSDTVSWWHMDCGRVLGVNDGRLIEYCQSTLAPLGLVVGQDQLKGKRVVVASSAGDQQCRVDIGDQEVGMEGADCVAIGSLVDGGAEQAVLLVDDEDKSVIVVQPNEDGSYWRKIVRNKIVRMKEKRRQDVAVAFATELLKESEEMADLNDAEVKGKAKSQVVSSWGPYTQISGTAKGTAIKLGQ